MKSAPALAADGRVVLASHGGDLDSEPALAAFRLAVHDLGRLHGRLPEVWAADRHPDYRSTREALASGRRVALVQHHHAHMAAVLAEHGRDGPALGVIWDGAGWGDDGTVWGGEFLAGGRADVRRHAHWRTFPLPGGDAAARDGRRAALGILWEIDGPAAFDHAWSRAVFSDGERRSLRGMLEAGVNTPRTSSVGRLFDAAAALLGLRLRSGFEGQSAMALEFSAGEEAHGPWPAPLAGDSPLVVDWEPMFREILSSSGPPRAAARFHDTLVAAAVEVVRRSGLPLAVLGGGCFQNARLLSSLGRSLTAQGVETLVPRRFPPNDGGLALGQAAVVRAREAAACA
jgi:hydrogenase maturation protein HypF